MVVKYEITQVKESEALVGTGLCVESQFELSDELTVPISNYLTI